jgi:hypothetical protein
MKISGFYIYRFLLIVAFCFIFIIGNSQEMKLTKKERKEAMKAERVKDYETLGTLLESKKFVYESHRIQSSTGVKMFDIIRLDGSKILVTLEDPKNTSGRNSGVWNNTSPSIGNTGFVFEGNIERWELFKYPKQLSYSIRFEVSRKGSNAEVVYEFFMNIHSDKSASVEMINRTVFTGFPRENRESGNYVNYTGHIKEY